MKDIKGEIKSSVLMVGVAIPFDLMSQIAKEDMFPGMQGFNHQWETINGIEHAYGKEIDLISFPQISDYPFNRIKYIRGRKWKHLPTSYDVIIPTINIFPFKLIFRFLSVTCEIFKWLLRNRGSKTRIIYLYSSQSSQLYSLLFLSFFFKIIKIAIVTDPPSMMIPGESKIKQVARRIDRYIQRIALKKFDGLIVLAKALATDLAPNVPYTVIEGIAPTISEYYPYPLKEDKLIITFAGTLKREYDIIMLLESLKFLDNNIELWIFGRGDLVDEIKSYELKDTRIKYFGFKPPEELRRIIQNSSAFISHLPTTGWYTKYKFPSKILEYMSLGRPVISTRYPTIPNEYEPFLIWIEEESPEGIAKAIQRLKELSPEERMKLGENCKEFVLKNKSEENQGLKAWHFTNSIIISEG